MVTELTYKNVEMGTLREHIMLDVVMKLELKRINIKHSFIIKNQQIWETLMEYMQLMFAMKRELV